MSLAGDAGEAVGASIGARQAAALPASQESGQSVSGIGQGRVVELWSQDRAALVACKRRHAGLARFYQVRDEGLR
ncbi:hypothetical protein [Amorphus orientalis]|uniref:Uncharacterized protein n=1 Tax=Amorphus orientalis TaxID=649198 RepID=A0AAE3VMU7_9HYPH|nr:hypothetical protein [Amorphus orientalis]MDQ0314870.1 hypothetical protein [Amorphus orientalis]